MSVKFQEETYTVSSTQNTVPQEGLAGLIVRMSGGRIKNKSQTIMVMLIIIVVSVVTMIVIHAGGDQYIDTTPIVDAV